MTREQAIAQFWEGMREIASAATEHKDEDLFRALRKAGRAILSRGIQVPEGGQFVPCPVCHAVPGRRCINMPRHVLQNEYHAERVELADKVREGAVPIPA